MNEPFPSCVRSHIQTVRNLVPTVSDEPTSSDPMRLGHNENNFGCCINNVSFEALESGESYLTSEEGFNSYDTSMEVSVNSSDSSSNDSGDESDSTRDSSFVAASVSEFNTSHLAQDILLLHRYSGSNQMSLKRDFARWRGLPSEDYVCLGMGALDLVDNIMRVTCEPKTHEMLITPPTFFAYDDRASINNISVVEVPLEFFNNDFKLRMEKIKEVIVTSGNIRLVMLASPGNPSGSLISVNEVKELLEFVSLETVVVIDETYIDFATNPVTSTTLSLVMQYPNLIVLNTLSKAQGLAGLRLGAAYAQPALIKQLSKVQLPHLIPSPVSFIGHLALSSEGQATTRKLVAHATAARKSLIQSLTSTSLKELGIGEILGGNQANFVLVAVLSKSQLYSNANARAKAIVSRLRSEHGIEIKFLGTLAGVDGCLRITVGTEAQQSQLIEGLKQVMHQC